MVRLFALVFVLLVAGNWITIFLESHFFGTFVVIDSIFVNAIKSAKKVDRSEVHMTSLRIYQYLKSEV